jgi:hypothetical protein
MAGKGNEYLTDEDIFVAENGSPVDIKLHIQDLRKQLAAKCPYCGGRIDIHPGHIDRCYCIPTIMELKKELEEKRVDIKYLSAEVETLQAQLKREREASKNLLRGLRCWGERAGQESVPAFVVGLLAAFKEDRK